MRSNAFWFMAAALGVTGCESNGAKPAVDAAVTQASSSAESSRASAAPAPPRPPVMSVDEHGCTIDGVAFQGEPTEWRERLAAALRDRPLVAGEVAEVAAMRNVKTPLVQALVAALAEAKAKSVTIRTPMRDQSMGELALTLHHPAPADCSVVAMIEHDGAVAVWSTGGGGAQKFSHGMAGPDLSTSTDAVRKRAAACDSPMWFVSGAESVQWGLTFDLAMRAKGGPDAGSTLRPTQTVLATHTPVAGRRVKDD